MPYVRGMHADGWASQHASVLVRPEWEHYRYLSLEGEVFRPMCPLSLRLAVGDQVLHELTINAPAFQIKEPLWKDGFPAQTAEIIEVNIHTDAAFSPQVLGVRGDTRALSYRVRRVALVDDQGDELVLYSDGRAWLLRVVLPFIVLWKSLLINRDIPGQELGRDIQQLRILRHSFLPSHRSGVAIR
jgi:hypothetical protein